MASTVDLRSPGWKRTAYSPRNLALRHGRRQLRMVRELRVAESDTGAAAPAAVGPLLSPGQEQLFSSYVPGLEAGLHRIDVEQDIVAGGHTLKLTTSHCFNVVAPRFALPDGAIDSFYPPPGHADRAEVLPHMVFNDPALPWDRVASTVTAPDEATNTVPWLAVLLFTRDELRLGSSDLSTMFAATSLGTGAKQDTNGAINMLASEIPSVKDIASAVLYDSDVDGPNAKTDLIFLPSTLFNAIFTQYNAQGQAQATPPQTNCCVRPFRFLAHLRDIHLDGTATAATTDDEQHTYSVIVCLRTGPLNITQPTTVVAHVVNIEGVEKMGWPVTQPRVAMSSLYSWEYTCLPPDSLDVGDAFAQLGTSIGPLRSTLTQGDTAALQAGGAVGTRLTSRLNDGFSMLRYRLQTGEVSAAFFRSPFTPTLVTFPATEQPPWPGLSTTGQNLQVLDPELNLMDLTYSAAWNLGKTLALADPTFAAALSRVRRQIFDMAMTAAQEAAVKTWASDLEIPSPYRTREDVVSSIAGTVNKVGELPGSKLLQRDPHGMAHRWFRREHPELDLTYKGTLVEPVIDQYLAEAAAVVASTTDDSGEAGSHPAPYNEFNVPYSPDWAVVLKWVMDRYFLVSVPPHYLISDASHLPAESLRFFNVDPAWVSAMVDGGLSLANHLDRSDDRIRSAIKGAINTYLTTPIPGLGYVPPVPAYGFLLRSALVTRFPDMMVGLEAKEGTQPPSGPPEILRHEVMGQDTLLGLLRVAPADLNTDNLILREPPHQQTFSAATRVTSQMIEMAYQRAYSDGSADDPDREATIAYTDNRGQTGNPDGVNFIWASTTDSYSPADVRILNMENYANNVQTRLLNLFNSHPGWYNAPYPTAALMGIEMSEPCWQLKVQLPYSAGPTEGGGPAAAAAVAGGEGGEVTSRAEWASMSAGHRPNPRVLLPQPSKRQPAPRQRAVFPEQPEVDCAPHPAFGDRSRSKPLRRIHPAPHTRLPRRTGGQGPLPLAQPSPPLVQPSGPPQFTYLLYPADAAAAGQSRIPMRADGRKQDLVFSIVLTPGTGQDFLLTSLTLAVPLGPPRPLVSPSQNYGTSGGTATMLSNMRFVAVAQLTLDGKTLLLSVRPRAVSGSWPAANITELSFLLSGVVVQQYTEDTSVEIPVVESYAPSRSYQNQFSVDLKVPKP